MLRRLFAASRSWRRGPAYAAAAAVAAGVAAVAVAASPVAAAAAVSAAGDVPGGAKERKRPFPGARPGLEYVEQRLADREMPYSEAIALVRDCAAKIREFAKEAAPITLLAKDSPATGDPDEVIVEFVVEGKYAKRMGDLVHALVSAADDKAHVQVFQTDAGNFVQVESASGLVARSATGGVGVWEDGGGARGGDTRLMFEKRGLFTGREIDAIMRMYAYAARDGDAVAQLEAMGLRVYKPDGSVGWDDIAGYEDVKRRVREGLVGVLEHPDVLTEMQAATRVRPPRTSRPKAVLFAGPPGTGKTSLARVIGASVGVPLVVAKAERLSSFLVGESEKNLARVFELLGELGPSILFLDEIETVASARNAFVTSVDRHDAKTLSVLLRHIEGFEEQPDTIVLGATNRPELIDPAMLSRFEMTVDVPLPTEEERGEILKLYARQLPRSAIDRLAAATDGLSGRTLRDVCAQAERSWAARIVRNDARRGTTPDLPTYEDACGAVPRM